jgi:hypothetical protein
MPLCPQITNTPITVTQTADFTVSSVTPITVATSTQVNQAQSTATTALANAATAYNAAVASLQPSASTIVNASNQMTAIAANGITVYAGSSPSSGARVVLNSTGLAGFNSGGSATFSVSATTGAAVFSGSVTGSTITGGTLNIGGNAIIDASGFLTATGATITGAITATSGTFTGTINSTSGSIAGFTLNATTITNGSSMTLYNNGDFYTGGVVSSGGGLYSTAACYLGSTLNVTGVFTAVDAGTNTNTNTANAWLSTGGVLRRTTASSIRYKENVTDITNVPELDPKKLLALPVRAFTYKEDYLSSADDRYQQLFPGFISEEVDAIYPMAADYENGEIESWNDRIMLPALLSLVQELYKRVEELEAK